MRKLSQVWIPIFLVAFATVAASAQSFRAQCPTNTVTHPDPGGTGVNNSEPAYNGPVQLVCSVQGGCTPTNNVGFLVPAGGANGAIKCQQVSGGDGYSTMGGRIDRTAGVQRVEDVRELGSWQAGSNVGQSGQGSKREHECLRAVGHGTWASVFLPRAGGYGRACLANAAIQH